MSMSETVVSLTITFKCAVHNALQYNPSSEAINIIYYSNIYYTILGKSFALQKISKSFNHNLYIYFGTPV